MMMIPIAVMNVQDDPVTSETQFENRRKSSFMNLASALPAVRAGCPLIFGFPIPAGLWRIGASGLSLSGRRPHCRRRHARAARTGRGPMPKARITIRLKPTVLDAQGAVVKNALHSLGFEAVQDVHMGKYIELDLAPGA